MISKLSLWLIAGVVVIALFLSLIKKKKPYNSFTRGCKDGLSLFVEVFPSVMAMLLAISMLEKPENVREISKMVSMACGKPMDIKYISNDTQVNQISQEESLQQFANDSDIPFNVIE